MVRRCPLPHVAFPAQRVLVTRLAIEFTPLRKHGTI